MLSNPQVARIHRRRKALGLTMPDLLARFADALRRAGSVHTTAAAKMRLDRVLNPRMRKPVSEETKRALARALEWTLEELEQSVEGERGRRSPQRHQELREVARALRSQAERLASLASRLAGIEKTHH